MAKERYYGISEQTKAGQHRLDDARVLFDAERWRGCMYLAGYPVECLLKAKLMRKFRRRHLAALEDALQARGALPNQGTVFTHQLEMLLRLTGVMDRMRSDKGIWRRFNTVNRWLPAWRYNASLSNREEAEDFLEAIDETLRWIENNV
jgi:HEPN domain-containing protein